jgi:hypothetical protein
MVRDGRAFPREARCGGLSRSVLAVALDARRLDPVLDDALQQVIKHDPQIQQIEVSEAAMRDFSSPSDEEDPHPRHVPRLRSLAPLAAARDPSYKPSTATEPGAWACAPYLAHSGPAWAVTFCD